MAGSLHGKSDNMMTEHVKKPLLIAMNADDIWTSATWMHGRHGCGRHGCMGDMEKGDMDAGDIDAGDRHLGDWE